MKPGTLQQVDGMKIRDSESCKTAKLQHNLLKERPLCAGTNHGEYSCTGESGSPLTLTNNKATQVYAVGIKSLRICEVEANQGLYTNVHYHIDWILHNVHH